MYNNYARRFLNQNNNITLNCVCYPPQSLIPILVTMMTLGVDMMIGTTLKVEPALKLDLSMFESSVSYYADHNEHGLSKCYKDQFQDPYKVRLSSCYRDWFQDIYIHIYSEYIFQDIVTHILKQNTFKELNFRFL